MAHNGSFGIGKNSNHRENDGEINQDEPKTKRQDLGNRDVVTSQTTMIPETQMEEDNSDPNSALFALIQQKAGQQQKRHNKVLGFKGTQALTNNSSGEEEENMDLDREGQEEGEIDESEDDKEEENEETEQTKEWTLVASRRERILAVKVALEDLRGETNKERLEDLMDVLLGYRINPVNKPSKMKIQGKQCFRVTVKNQAEMDALLEVMTDDGLNPAEDDEEEDDINRPQGMEIPSGKVYVKDSQVMATPRPLFQRIDIFAEQHINMERSVEIYGIPAKVDSRLIKTAMHQLGDIEKVMVRGCARGVKLAAVIRYTDGEAVETAKKVGLRNVTIGTEMVRIKKLGSEHLKWDLEHVCKLHGLPNNTTPVDLMGVLSSMGIKADFIEIPKIYINNGRHMRYRQEAFIYFRNEKDMTDAVARSIRIGKSDLMWLPTNDKRCYTCNGKMHVGTKCPMWLEQMESRSHKKRVMEFHATTAAKVKVGTSFADILNGNKQAVRGYNNNKVERLSQKRGSQKEVTFVTGEHFPPLPSTTKTLGQQKTDNYMSMGQQDSFAKLMSEQIARQKALETTITDMKKTIHYLMERQTEMMENMQDLMKIIVAQSNGQFTQKAEKLSQSSNTMGNFFSQSQREDTPLEDNRTTLQMRQNLISKGKSNATSGKIPSTNESRAGIEKVILEHKKKNGNDGDVNIVGQKSKIRDTPSSQQ
ncbi:hypothetical protein BGZ76_005004 [Entomortierella beljakovae]|nr:hypothetical protein BGZ76_005004 [Entomortierella beljakovae]